MSVQRLDATFSALADPTRRAILTRLARGEATVQELAAPFDMSLPAISKHLKVLEKAGLIERGRDAQRRPCRLQAKPLEDASNWIESYRQFWEASFDRLEDYLAELQGKPKPRRSASPKTRSETKTETKTARTNRTKEKRHARNRPN